MTLYKTFISFFLKGRLRELRKDAFENRYAEIYYNVSPPFKSKQHKKSAQPFTYTEGNLDYISPVIITYIIQSLSKLGVITIDLTIVFRFLDHLNIVSLLKFYSMRVLQYMIDQCIT